MVGNKLRAKNNHLETKTTHTPAHTYTQHEMLMLINLYQNLLQISSLLHTDGPQNSFLWQRQESRFHFNKGLWKQLLQGSYPQGCNSQGPLRPLHQQRIYLRSTPAPPSAAYLRKGSLLDVSAALRSWFEEPSVHSPEISFLEGKGSLLTKEKQGLRQVAVEGHPFPKKDVF